MNDVELPSGPPGRALTGGFAACLASVTATRSEVACGLAGGVAARSRRVGGRERPHADAPRPAVAPSDVGYRDPGGDVTPISAIAYPPAAELTPC
jgi:hypothetical protein